MLLVILMMKINFPHKLLLTNTQVSKFHPAFENDSSANEKLSKTQLHKIGQSGGFLGRILGRLLKGGLSLIENVFKPLAKSVLMPLGSIVAALAIVASLHNKIFGEDVTTLIISNEKMNDVMNMVTSLEESRLLIKDVSKTIKHQAKEQKGGFIGMLLGTLSASLLGNLLTGKGTKRASEGKIRVDQDF